MSRHQRDRPLDGRAGVGKILPGRVFERTQGCWNCKHFDNEEKSRNFWELAKQRDLATAKVLAQADPRGESAPKVIAIRKTVREAGAAIASGAFGICLNNGVQSDFVENTHLCAGWSGRTGASLARAGSGPDTLPDELKDKVDP
jgi:hypothetical protein